jgi:endonuclease/exonuclease/phosphatase (EEP) superfamily protein YafD
MRSGWRRQLLTLVGGVLAFWAVMASAGWSGVMGWQAELFANFPAASVLAVGTAMVLLAFNSSLPAAALGSLALVGVTLSTMAPRPVLPAGDCEGETLKFATWNACFGKVDPQAVRRWVDAEQPDVIAFTEITQQLHGILEKSLRVQYPYTLGNPRGGPNGLAFFSKLPLANWKRESGDARYGTCELRWPAGPVCELIVAHPPAPTSGGWFRARGETLRELSAKIAGETRPVIVLGDLNATWAVRDFREFCHAAELLPATNYLPSWNAVLPDALRIPIDHVLARPRDFVAVSAAVGTEPGGSDHLPVVAEIGLRLRPATASR